MTSWVYLFSQFTPEALLFETLIIFLLCCGYTAFWILKKRKYGVIDNDLPSGPVQSYLNELIGTAEQLRLQLFGLLAPTDYSARQYKVPSDATRTPDPNLLALEAKLQEQTKAFAALTAEKNQLVKNLAELKSQSAGNSQGNPKEADPVVVKKMQDMESRLAEYSVIEDDLANLKRLQQENIALKAALTAKGIPIPIVETPSFGASAPPPLRRVGL